MSTQGDTDPKSNNPPGKPKANTNQQKSGGALLAIFLFLTFLLVVGGLGAGYYVWQQMQQQLQSAQVERQALEHALGNLDENPRIQNFSHRISKKVDDLNLKINKLAEQQQNIASEQARLAGIVEQTREVVGRSQKGWMLKEVEHVLRMSQHRLLLDRDFEGAQTGLKAADQRLKEINDVRLIPIRQSIARQTSKLNQFPHPDYVGIQLSLDNVIAQLKTGLVEQATSITDSDQQQKQPETDKAADHKEQAQPMDVKRAWEIARQFVVQTMSKAKTTLSNSVNITHGEQKVALFIEQQEKKRAYDFLRSKLLTAKYSVSTRDDIAFHQQLNAALAWLENNEQFANSESLAGSIREINEHNLMPALPDITEPSTLLAKYMNTLKDKK